MLRRSDNLTEEDMSFSRADMQAFIDEGRPKKNGKPDRTKKSRYTKNDVKDWLKIKGMDNDSMLEKAVGDLDSYL